MEKPILLEVPARKIGIVWFNRPASLNAFDIDMVRAFAATIDGLYNDAGLKVLVLAGKGRGFSAGNDLKADMTPDEAREAQELGRKTCLKLMYMPQLTVAAIHGFAVGGGFEIAMAADLRVAAAGARLSMPELKLGMPVAWGGWNVLAKLVGVPMAKEIMFLGEHVGATRARDMGLVSKVFPDEGFMDAVMGFARELKKRDLVAIQLAKLAVNQAPQLPLTGTTALAGEIFNILALPTREKNEAIRELRDRLVDGLF